MWRDIEGASEILAITNGVHVPTWQDARIHKARGAADGRWAAHHTLKGIALIRVITHLTNPRSWAIFHPWPRNAAPRP